MGQVASQLPDLISVQQAADMAGVTYHCMLGWIKRNRYGLGEVSKKVEGGGWIVQKKSIEVLVDMRKGRSA